MPAPLAAGIWTASLLVPVLLHVVSKMQGDPEADVSLVLKQMAAQEQREPLMSALTMQRAGQDIAEMTRMPIERGVQTQQLLGAGAIDPQELPAYQELGPSIDEVQDAVGPTLAEVVSKTGKSPTELRQRLDPRRLGMHSVGTMPLGKAAMQTFGIEA